MIYITKRLNSRKPIAHVTPHQRKSSENPNLKFLAEEEGGSKCFNLLIDRAKENA